MYMNSKFSNFLILLIKFFEKYPILGEKAKDFNDFSIVAGLMKKKLTIGVAKIQKIKEGMNRGR